MCYQEEVSGFDVGLCCTEEERGQTPGREHSPSNLGEADLDLRGDAKTGEDKAFGRSARVDLQGLWKTTCPTRVMGNFTCLM